MSQGSGLFREQALAALSAQEDFNQRARILGPGRWLWVIAIAAVLAGFAAWSVLGKVTVVANGVGLLTAQGGLTEIVAPVDGVLLTSLPELRYPVQAGASLARVRGFDGLDYEVASVVDGTLEQVSATVGDAVSAGDRLALTWRSQVPLVFEAFVPLAEAKSLRSGSRAVISPANVNARTYGGILGTVTKVGQVAMDRQGIYSLVESEALTEQIAAQGPVVAVEVAPVAADTASGFEWTTSTGPDEPISIGTPATVSIEVHRMSLVSLVGNSS